MGKWKTIITGKNVQLTLSRWPYMYIAYNINKFQQQFSETIQSLQSIVIVKSFIQFELQEFLLDLSWFEYFVLKD